MNTADQTSELGSGGRSSVALVRGSAIVWTLALVLGYSTLARKLGSERGGSDIAFRVAFVIGVIGSSLAAIRARRIAFPIARAMRETPVRLVLAALNLGLAAWLILNVFGKWGFIADLALSGGLLCGATLAPADRGATAADQFIRKSGISFIMVWILLGALEVVLWSNPMAVGGGGGGNPAMRHLYADLYTTNSHGFRGAEFPLKPAPGTIRILMLGDSFTVGQGVEDDETYPACVEAILNEEAGPTRYEVINAGVSGTNTADHLERLNSNGLKFEPDLVTVQFYVNDLDPPSEDVSWIETRIEDVLYLPSRRSYAVFFLKYRFESAMSAALDDPGAGPGGGRAREAVEIDTSGPGWRVFQDAVRGIAGVARERGIPAVLIVYPRPGIPPAEQEPVHDAVARVSRSAGIPVIDLIRAFESLPPEKQFVSEIDHHPSAAVHRLAARRIVEELRELELLPALSR